MVVNSHYKAEMIHAHVDGMDDIILSPEDDLLETGGGVCKALPYLGSQPFYVINCDSVWNDKSPPALDRLSKAWRDNDMDGLLLLQPRENAVGYNGAGDFSIDKAGRIRRRAEGATAPLVFMGVQLLHPRLFEGCVVARYSLNRLYDQALVAGRLFGLVHDDDWFHVGTPEDLAVTERLMSADESSE